MLFLVSGEFRLFPTTPFEGKSNTFLPCASMKTAPGKEPLRNTRSAPVTRNARAQVAAQLTLCSLQVNHEGKCEFMIISCPSCKEHIRFNEQERHNERECPERTLNCKYCKEPFHFKNIKVGHVAHVLFGRRVLGGRTAHLWRRSMNVFFFSSGTR